MRLFLVSHVLSLTISVSQYDDHDPRTYVSRLAKHSNPDISRYRRFVDGYSDCKRFTFPSPA
jgi:hypothetical protein